jgi:hypothetical protein
MNCIAFFVKVTIGVYKKFNIFILFLTRGMGDDGIYKELFYQWYIALFSE